MPKAIEPVLQLADGTLVLDSQARTNLASTAPRFLELPQAAGKATEV